MQVQQHLQIILAFGFIGWWLFVVYQQGRGREIDEQSDNEVEQLRLVRVFHQYGQQVRLDDVCRSEETADLVIVTVASEEFNKIADGLCEKKNNLDNFIIILRSHLGVK